MSEWQPIETAPKDGSVVLIADAEHVNEAHYVFEVGEFLVSNYPDPYWEKYDHSYWDRHNDDSDWYEPTHWMPLPPPPNPNTTEQKGE